MQHSINFVDKPVQISTISLNSCGLLHDKFQDNPNIIVPFKSIIGLSAFIFKEKYISDPKWYKYKIRKLVNYNKSKCKDIIIILREFAHTYKCDNLLKVLDLIKPISKYNMLEFYIVTENNLKLTAQELAYNILVHNGIQSSDSGYYEDTFKEFEKMIPNHTVDYNLWVSTHNYLPNNIKYGSFKCLHKYKFSQKHIPYLNYVFTIYASEIKSICDWLDGAKYTIRESDELEPLSTSLHKLVENLINQGYKIKYRSEINVAYCDACDLDNEFKQKRKWLKYKIMEF